MRSSRTPFFGGRWAPAVLIALSTFVIAPVASGQQLIPFGDVPATADFSEQEIAARGQQQARSLTYSDWTKVCFRGVAGADAKMVCRTTITGKWDTGQVTLRVDLIEREEAPAARLQIFLLPGFFLQPGIKLTIDKGSSMHVPTRSALPTDVWPERSPTRALSAQWSQAERFLSMRSIPT
jgi:invasion protein IalB